MRRAQAGFTLLEIILAMTYSVVVFSIIVQGLTIERVARRHAPVADEAARS